MSVFELQFDFSQIEAKALALASAQDQIPYVMATALNEAANETRKLLISDWPSHVTVRNQSFIAASLTTKGTRATKGNLTVEIYDRLENRLQLLAVGGERAPRGNSIAVPSSQVRLTSRGVGAANKPRALKNSFIKGDVLYQRITRGKNKGRLKLMYVLKPRTSIPKQMPFYELFATHMRDALDRVLPAAVARAMATRRAR